jgi:hypothetical protein
MGEEILPVITYLLLMLLCIGIGIPLPVPAPMRADPEAQCSPKKNRADPGSSKYYTDFRLLFDQCCVCLTPLKMFMNVDVKNKIFVIPRCRIRPSFSLKKQLVSRSARPGNRRRQLNTGADTF